MPPTSRSNNQLRFDGRSVTARPRSPADPPVHSCTAPAALGAVQNLQNHPSHHGDGRLAPCCQVERRGPQVAGYECESDLPDVLDATETLGQRAFCSRARARRSERSSLAASRSVARRRR